MHILKVYKQTRPSPQIKWEIIKKKKIKDAKPMFANSVQEEKGQIKGRNARCVSLSLFHSFFSPFLKMEGTDHLAEKQM